MRFVTALCAFACLILSSSAFAQKGFVLRDTTALPPPAAGMARLVVARDMAPTEYLKPEFVFVDSTPVGVMPQRTAVTTEVPAGWHRVWLGRGSKAEVWMEFVPDGRYLLRLREIFSGGTWRGDLVRESGEGYAEFALNREMKLAVMDARGKQDLEKDLKKVVRKWDPQAREKATASAALPIVIQEAWFLPIPSDADPGTWQNHTGVLTLDGKSLRFVRADTLVVEIPRESMTNVRFGNMKGGLPNPWIKVGFREDMLDKGATFADATSIAPTATQSYNRLFAEIEKGLAPR
jgi:hypothetical protein